MSYRPEIGDWVVAVINSPWPHQRPVTVRGRVTGVCNRRMGIFQIVYIPVGDEPVIGRPLSPGSPPGAAVSRSAQWVAAKQWTAIWPDTPEEAAQRRLDHEVCL